MIDLEVALGDAAGVLPDPPPMHELAQRVSRRRNRRTATAAVPLALLLAVAGAVVLQNRDVERTTVTAADPLGAALAPYGRELIMTPAPEPHPSEPADAVPGSYRVLGALKGETVAVFDRVDHGPGERPTCLQTAASRCMAGHAHGEPSTFAVGRSLVWLNVPADAVAVGLVAQDGSQWQRPYHGFAYFPLEVSDAWSQFEIKAFAADGAVLASEHFDSAAARRMTVTWIDEAGQPRARVYENL